jgi:hypothetical protein
MYWRRRFRAPHDLQAIVDEYVGREEKNSSVP